MQVIRTYQDVPSEARGATAAIGNFDGVHLGHQAVINQARAAAPASPLAVLTFEPHPREFFAPKAPAFRLMDTEARAHRLEKVGVDILFELPFNADLASLSPEAFAQDVIAEGLGLGHVTVGGDFHFGKARAGSPETLAILGKANGFETHIATLIEGPQGEISSTAIRTALSEGRPQDAAAMLGHWHRIEGEVISGHQRGRELGFPTANIALGDLHLPKLGVYAVALDILTGPHAGSYHGAASLGTRPMFGDNIPNLETFIFDFQGDIYGETVSVGLAHYLRPEETFPSLESFIAQMQKDCDDARRLLAS